MTLFTEKIRGWMSDWGDRFDQSWSAERIQSEILGRRIEMTRPEIEDANGEMVESRTFTFGVVGWTVDRLQDDEGLSAYRWSILNDEGQQVPIHAGSTIVVLED